MNENLKKEYVSMAITFVAAFFVAIGGELAVNGEIALTTSGLFALLLTGVRAAVKALAVTFIK